MQAHQAQADGFRPVALGEPDARSRFVMRTYNHLFASIVAFTLIEVALFQSGAAAVMAPAMLGVSWLAVLGAFMVIGWLATRMAHRAASLTAQYTALGLYVVAEAVIFVPMLWIANEAAAGLIESAALVTLLGFGGLTGVAFVTRRDFSFLGGMLRWVGLLALVAIGGGVIFGFELGTWFSVAMVGFAGAAILHDTSNVLHSYPEDRYVGAALELFASVALMFWYVLRLFMSRD